MDRTPQPLVANLVEPLGPHMRQKAPDELVGGQRQGVPTLVLGVLVAKAPLAIIDGEETGVGQRDAVDISAQVVQAFLRACPAGLPETTPPLVQTTSGLIRSGCSWRTRSSYRPRNRFARAGTGTREDVRAGRHSVRSAETPPAGTRQWTCGWEVRVRVQVWRIHKTPIRPPT